MKALAFLAVTLLMGCHTQTAKDRLTTMAERGREGYGVAPSWPVKTVQIVSSDQTVDKPAALKATDDRLEGHVGTGKVRAKVVIDSTGKVGEVVVLETTARECVERASAELRKCRFYPATKDGRATTCTVVCVIEFKQAND